jgi:hypothetical protein
MARATTRSADDHPTGRQVQRGRSPRDQRFCCGQTRSVSWGVMDALDLARWQFAMGYEHTPGGRYRERLISA